MADIIHLLPDHVANQIAAGEVIQRPASVVKELLENAIDSGASEINLIVKDSGKTLIQVTDNGCGMSEIDARSCFERHATSKIQAANDLQGLKTKGFRGEALASIAAIAHVTLKTKLHDEELGQQIKIEGSELKEQEFCQSTSGCSFSVKNLFYNVPARRNFLKSDKVEFNHIQEEFFRIAYAHKNIKFTFKHNDKELMTLPSAQLRQRIVAILGDRYNERLVPVEGNTDIIGIKGFVTKPEFAKKTKGEQYMFINGRFIRSGYLHHAVMGAYDGFIPHKTFPSYFLYFDIAPQSIDVNIHPTKTEVKFEEERAIYAILKSSVKQGLGQFNAVPSMDFEPENAFSPPPLKKNESVQVPDIKVDPNYNPFDNSKDQNTAMKKQGFDQVMPSQGDWENFYGVKQSQSEEEQLESFSDEETSSKEVSTLQVMEKYILTTLKNGVVLIDQKRAHERILYDQYMIQFQSGHLNSQQLLHPEQIDMTPNEKNLIEQHTEALQKVGFNWQWSDNVMELTGIPATATDAQPKKLLQSLIESLQHEDNLEAEVSEPIAQGMARSSAVRYGQKLDRMEMNHIIDRLFACKTPYYSPFGQPTIVTFTAEEILKRFQVQ